MPPKKATLVDVGGGNNLSKKRTNVEISSANDESSTPRAPLNRDLVPQIRNLFENPKYSDLIIVCQGRTFNCHRLVCGLQSPVLAVQIEKNSTEASAGTIELQDDPDTVHRLLHFLYKGKYLDGTEPDSQGSTPTSSINPSPSPAHSSAAKIEPDFEVPTATSTCSSVPSTVKTEPTPTPSTTSSILPTVNPVLSEGLLCNAKVYVLASKYEILPLKRLAVQKYQTLLPQEWDNASGSFVASLRLIYDTIPEDDRQLKDIAVEFAHEKGRELREMESFTQLCKDQGAFTFDMYMTSMPGSVQKKQFNARVCEICGSHGGAHGQLLSAVQSGALQCSACLKKKKKY